MVFTEFLDHLESLVRGFVAQTVVSECGPGVIVPPGEDRARHEPSGRYNPEEKEGRAKESIRSHVSIPSCASMKLATSPCGTP
jgi:hypothetical protein